MSPAAIPSQCPKGNYESVPFAEHVSETLSVLDCSEDLKVPDTVAVAPEQYDEAPESDQSGDSSV